MSGVGHDMVSIFTAVLATVMVRDKIKSIEYESVEQESIERE